MRILLTGDDGYNSIGTRLLIAALKDTYDLTVVGTKTQQSAVGGMLHVNDGCAYTETTLDGIPAYVVEGSPGDAMEFAHTFFETPFDCVISGINLGENVSISIVSSGTVCAAVRAYALGVAPKAIAISWTTPTDFYFKKHDETEDLTPYLQHPGKSAGTIIVKALEANLFGASLLNINLPRQKPKGIRFTRLSRFVGECYPPISIDRDERRFSYPFVELKRATKDHTRDVQAMAAGYISITPMHADWTDDTLFETLQSVRSLQDEQREHAQLLAYSTEVQQSHNQISSLLAIFPTL